MTSPSADVDRFVASLAHPLRDVVVALRSAILRADPRVTERIKWKAPSFGYAGDDRVTMNLHRPDQVQLVFHRGAKVRDSTGFSFDDPDGLLRWAAPDRAILTLTGPDDLATSEAAIVQLVARWLAATTD